MWLRPTDSRKSVEKFEQTDKPFGKSSPESHPNLFLHVKLPFPNCLSFHFSFRSISTLQPGPNRLMAQMTLLLAIAMTPTPVKSEPLPIAEMSGSATIAPTHEKTLRMQLLSATPADALAGMNSVSIVVIMPKMSILPMPKKKLAMSWGERSVRILIGRKCERRKK